MQSPYAARLRPGKPVYAAREDINIYIIGNAGVGKTTLIQRFMNPSAGAVQARSTINMDLETMHNYLVPLPAAGEELPSAVFSTTLRLWDTGGDEAFRSTTKIGLRKADIIIYAFDAAEGLPYRSCLAMDHTWKSIVASAGVMERPYRQTPEQTDLREGHYPFFAMFGCKVDILDAHMGSPRVLQQHRINNGVPPDVVSEVFDAVCHTKKEEMPIAAPLYTSGMSGQSVQEAFQEVVRAYLQRERALKRLHYVGDGHDSFGDIDAPLVTAPSAATVIPRGTIRVIDATPKQGNDRHGACCG